MLRAEEEIFLKYTDTLYIYKVYIPACYYNFIVSELDFKFEDISVTADLCTRAEVTIVEVTTMDVHLPNVNSASSTTVTLISFPSQ